MAKISLKLKNKSVITVFVSIMFLAAYYFVYFKAQSLISELIANAAVYGEKDQGLGVSDSTSPVKPVPAIPLRLP